MSLRRVLGCVVSKMAAGKSTSDTLAKQRIGPWAWTMRPDWNPTVDLNLNSVINKRATSIISFSSSSSLPLLICSREEALRFGAREGRGFSCWTLNLKNLWNNQSIVSWRIGCWGTTKPTVGNAPTSPSSVNPASVIVPMFEWFVFLSSSLFSNPRRFLDLFFWSASYFFRFLLYSFNLFEGVIGLQVDN